MYEVFLGDLLPGELGALLHRTGKYSSLSQNNVPACKKNCLWKHNEGKEARQRERGINIDKESCKVRIEKVEVFRQGVVSPSLGSKHSLLMWVAAKCCICYQNALRISVVWDQYHWWIYTALFPLPTRVNVQRLIALWVWILTTPLLLLGGPQNLPASVFQVFVEVRETGRENNFSHVVIFDMFK